MKNNCLMYLVITAFLLAVSVSAISQKSEIEWGKELKEDPRNGYGSLIAEDDENYYLYKSKRKPGFLSLRSLLNIELHDINTHELKKEFPINHQNGEIEDDVEIQRVVTLNGKILSFVSKYDSKKDKSTLEVRPMGLDGRKEESIILVQENVKKKKNQPSYSVNVSPDESKVLLVHTPAYDENAPEKLNYTMLKNDLTTLWSKQIELPFKDKEFSIEKIMVDDNGNVILVGSTKRARKKDAPVEYRIYGYDYREDEVTGIKVDFEEFKYIFDANIFYSRGAVHFIGFYANDKKAGMQGVFYNRINPTTFEIENKSIAKFDRKTLEELTSKSQASKGKGIQTTFDIKSIFTYEDGRIKIVAEKQYIVVTSRDQMGLAISIDYHNDEILVMQLNKLGEFDWMTVIPKFQVSTNDEGLYNSFMCVSKGENLYFFFNDNIENLEPKKDKTGEERIKKVRPQKVRKTVIMAVRVDNEGNISRSLVDKDKKYNASLVPKYSGSMNNGRTLVIGVGPDTRKYGYLSILDKGNEKLD